jgi:hypothetical protein
MATELPLALNFLDVSTNTTSLFPISPKFLHVGLCYLQELQFRAFGRSLNNVYGGICGSLNNVNKVINTLIVFVDFSFKNSAESYFISTDYF